MRNKFAVAFGIIGILLVVAIVYSQSQKQNGGNDIVQIAVIPKGTTHTYWKTAQAGAEAAGRDFGGNVKVLWKGPLLENDREEQIKIVQSFVAQGVDAIALCPLDSEALVPPVLEAHSAGKKIVIWDSAIGERADAVVSSFIATNNKQAGRLMAEELTGEIKSGTVVIMRKLLNSASTDAREEGFKEVLDECCPNIKLVGYDQYAGVNIESARRFIDGYLQQDIPDLVAVFGSAEHSTEAATRAILQNDLQGQIAIFGFDNNDFIEGAVADGVVEAIAVQDPYKMGYLSVQNALKAIRGESVERVIDTSVVIVTDENIREEDVQKLLQ